MIKKAKNKGVKKEEDKTKWEKLGKAGQKKIVNRRYGIPSKKL